MSRLDKHLDEDRVATALQRLAESDEPCAIAKAAVESTEFKAKSMKATVFMHLTGTVAEREAQALTDESVQASYMDHFAAIREYNLIANKRALEELVIRAWQSMGANRRQGG